jgi:hypothetical protein
VGLGFANRTMISNTFLFSEILTFEPDDRFTALCLGLDDRALCLTVQRAQWRLLPRDVRIRLVESGELQKFLALVMIPAWIVSCTRWKSRMDKYLIRELEPATLAELRAQIAPVERFVKRHPKFATIWPSKGVLLGH